MRMQGIWEESWQEACKGLDVDPIGHTEGNVTGRLKVICKGVQGSWNNGSDTRQISILHSAMPQSHINSNSKPPDGLLKHLSGIPFHILNVTCCSRSILVRDRTCVI